MPNWAYTEIYCKTKEQLNFLRENFSTNDILDFNKIIKRPKELEFIISPVKERDIAFYTKDKNLDDIRDELLKTIQNPVFTEFPEKLKKKIKNAEIDNNDYKKVLESSLERMKKEYKDLNLDAHPCLNSVEEYGKQCLYNYLAYGHMTWYDWSIENWDTKWALYDTYWNENSLYFQTAWSPPFAIIKKLSSLIDFPTYVTYAEEQFNYVAGEMLLENGKILKENHYDFKDIGEFKKELFKIASVMLDPEQEDYKWDEENQEILYSWQAYDPDDPDYIPNWDELPTFECEELQTDMYKEFYKNIKEELKRRMEQSQNSILNEFRMSSHAELTDYMEKNPEDPRVIELKEIIERVKDDE